MNHALDTAELLAELATRVLLDVRSPGEFTQGHIPGALSFPLFSDEERAQVGTLYKQNGKEAAMLRGLDIVGPKMGDFVRQAGRLAHDKRLAVHCWRGGQRSGSMAWLLRTAGFEVVTLSGGYKNYRRHVLEYFEHLPFQFVVLGGRTGSGKTKILHALRGFGEQIVDLEALAHHKGSSFGSIGEMPQPTVEQFENDVFDALRRLDPSRRVWLENESRSIGRVFIPPGLWAAMKKALLLNVEIPDADRVQNLVADYADCPAGELEAAFQRIDRKLGGQHLKAALEALEQRDFAAAAGIALAYYDKTYQHGLDTNPSPDIRRLKFNCSDPEKIALACLEMAGGR